MMGRPKAYLSKEREDALREFWFRTPQLPLRLLAAEWGSSISFISTAAKNLGLPSRQRRSNLRHDNSMQRFELVIESRRYLEREAHDRGLLVRELEDLLIQTIANDRMVNAVLDDKHEATEQVQECRRS